MRRHRKACYRRFHLAGRSGFWTALLRLPLAGLLGIFVKPQPASLFRGDLNISKNRSDRVAFAFLGKDLDKSSRAWRSDSHHSLVRLHFDDVAIGFDGSRLP